MIGSDFFSDLAKGQAAPDWLSAFVATRWDLPGAVEVALLSVSENASFLVRLNGDSHAVLRLNRPGYIAGSASVRSEARWVAAIARDTEVDVTVPIVGLDGDEVQEIIDPDGTLLTGMLSGFVTGSVLEDVAAPLPWFDRIGRDSARLHEHARSWSPEADFDRFDWDVQYMVGPDARWGQWHDAAITPSQATLLARAQEQALQTIATFEKTPETWGLIHADIRPSNVIVDGDRMTIIDFDDCGYGWFLHDFASAMTWLDHLPEAPELAQAWVRGYRDVRPSFTQADARAASALDTIRALTMLGWCTTHRQEAIPAAVRDVVVDTTCAVAEASLVSETWLFD